MTVSSTPPSLNEFEAAEERRAALGYVAEAFAEAILAGIEADCLAQAALSAAFQELVGAHGEEAVAILAESLPERVRNGEFSLYSRH
ncbi:MAG: hypothetical protein JWN93_3550 [Hyphomicrobiales bacterium]|jgi:predicted YcjX-like family ATPase|nr:hypothetical protein [Hyphomicrobiales bacterium]